jgi:hypothetical protein
MAGLSGAKFAAIYCRDVGDEAARATTEVMDRRDKRPAMTAFGVCIGRTPNATVMACKSRPSR